MFVYVLSRYLRCYMLNVCVRVVSLSQMLDVKCLCVCVVSLSQMLDVKCVCVCVCVVSLS